MGISSLPPELVSHIFKIGHRAEVLDESVLWPDIRKEGRLRREFLRSVSLVSPFWKELGQRELWADVTIIGEETASLFLSSPAKGGYPTETLTLWSKPPSGMLTGRTAAFVIEACAPELKSLAVSGVYGIPVEVLCSPQISSTKSLTAGVHLFSFRNPLHRSLQLPFTLNHLSITIRTQGSNYNLNDLLPLLQPPPSSLTLILANGNSQPVGPEETPLYSWLPNLKSIAPYIQNISIDRRLMDFPDFRDEALILNPFLADCTFVTSITSYPLFGEALQLLPSLQTWTIPRPPTVSRDEGNGSTVLLDYIQDVVEELPVEVDTSLEQFGKELLAKPTRLPSLKEVRVDKSWYGAGGERGTEPRHAFANWDKVREACLIRKIKISFVDAWKWRTGW